MRQPRTCHIVSALVALAVAFAAHAAPPPLPGIATATIASPDTDLPLPDSGSLVSVLTVSGIAGVVVDVDVTIDLVHPQSDQLDVFLVSPSGTTVTLTTDNGGANDDVFAGATFDDQASGTPSAPCVRNVTYTDMVPIGAVQPEGALGAVVGEAANGPWALVVIDDGGGQTGMLRSWSLTISTVGAFQPGAPLTFVGAGGAIPDNDPSGRVATLEVNGAGRYLSDLDLSVDISHPNAADLDVYLTAPSGRRIDVVTDVGGGNDDLYAGTVFDDQAGTPVSDLMTPASGTAFPTAVPEGALSAFLGEDPNGTWTLTVADDTGGNSGTLNGWSLRVVSATVCGDGVVDAGEQCDDGNALDGDGCDANCTPTGCGNGVRTVGEDCDDGNTANGDGCPASCRTGESNCGDCVDDDGNGLVDAADPACPAAALELRSGTVGPAGARGKVTVGAALAVPASTSGSVALSLADGSGTLACAELGPLRARGRVLVAKGRVGSGTLVLKLKRRSGTLALSGRGLDLGALDDPNLTLGIALGDARFLGSGTFRPRGRRWVFP